MKKIGVFINPRIQEREDARRQEVIEKIVERIDVFILEKSDGTVEMTDDLTKKTAMSLIGDSLGLGIVYGEGNEYLRFCDTIRNVMHQTIIENGMEKSPVGNWIRMQVALKFAEKAAIPFSDSLRNYDLAN